MPTPTPDTPAPPAIGPRRGRRWLRRAGLGLAAVLAVWMVYVHLAPRTPHAASGAITCPFLAMDPPPDDGLWAFARGAEANGMSLPMALVVGMQTTAQQKGLGAALRLEAPDIRRLREVPGVSHDDRFAPHLAELRPLADSLAVDGQITLQQLVGLKEWVAAQEGVAVGEASRIETALAFVRAGGDAETWTVGVEDLFTLLAGRRPAVDVVVTPGALSQAREAAVWTP